MINRVLRFALLGAFTDGPQLSLRLPQVVPDNSAVFECAVHRNLAGMKLLFDRGLTSPFNVGAGTGRTPLHVSTSPKLRQRSLTDNLQQYAVNYDHPRLASFLLSIGADPHVEEQEQV